MRKTLAAAALCLIGSFAFGQSQDPQSVLTDLIRQQQQQNAIRQQNERDRLEIEHLDLQERLRYRRMTDLEIGGELARYCPGTQPQCASKPPQPLLQEAVRRGLLTMRHRGTSPGTDCLVFGDGAGGGIVDCQ